MCHVLNCFVSHLQLRHLLAWPMNNLTENDFLAMLAQMMGPEMLQEAYMESTREQAEDNGPQGHHALPYTSPAEMIAKANSLRQSSIRKEQEGKKEADVIRPRQRVFYSSTPLESLRPGRCVSSNI
jgi:hypothetical protein